MAIAERVEKALTELGWSQRQLAEACGYATQSHVGNTLRRIREDPGAIELNTVYKLAAGLGVSRFWLLTGLGDPRAEESTEQAPFRQEWDCPNRNAVLLFFADEDPRAILWLAKFPLNDKLLSRKAWSELLFQKIRELEILDGGSKPKKT